MNKKERKAEAVLKEARMIAAKVAERINAPKAVEAKKTTFPRPKPKAVVPKVEVKPIVFDKPLNLTDINICKVAKGDFKLTAFDTISKQKVAKHFKTVTKAEEWAAKHGKRNENQ